MQIWCSGNIHDCGSCVTGSNLVIPPKFDLSLSYGIILLVRGVFRYAPKVMRCVVAALYAAIRGSTPRGSTKFIFNERDSMELKIIAIIMWINIITWSIIFLKDTEPKGMSPVIVLQCATILIIMLLASTITIAFLFS